MTAIAPNGVTMADYDPKGIGALVMAGVNSNFSGGTTFLGSVISGSNLYPCGLIEAEANVFLDGSQTLPGNWMCLGYLLDGAVDSATLWMRVS